VLLPSCIWLSCAACGCVQTNSRPSPCHRVGAPDSHLPAKLGLQPRRVRIPPHSPSAKSASARRSGGDTYPRLRSETRSGRTVTWSPSRASDYRSRQRRSRTGHASPVSNTSQRRRETAQHASAQRLLATPTQTSPRQRRPTTTPDNDARLRAPASSHTARTPTPLHAPADS
jgi:hypothetical protein